MKTLKFISTVFIIQLVAGCGLIAQDHKTFTYLTEGKTAKELDLFLPTKSKPDAPLVIFMHGGGFASGVKEDGHLFCKYLANEGYMAASISYSLYMADKDFSCGGITSEKIKAIQLAANDLWTATSFLLNKQKELGFNPSKIIIAGSSAGAETVLHAAYWDRKVMSLIDHQLPSEFKYAGIISGAGAIMDLNLITEEKAIPTLLFHGDKDDLVPYGTAAHHFCEPSATGWLMLFGPASIHQHHQKLGQTCNLITFKDKNHDVAAALFKKDQHHLTKFLDKVISGSIFHNQLEITD